MEFSWLSLVLAGI